MVFLWLFILGSAIDGDKKDDDQRRIKRQVAKKRLISLE